MDAATINSYHALATSHALISKSETLLDALVGCARICVDILSVSSVVIWALDEQSSVLRPVFWHAPYDLSGCSCVVGEGDVGTAFTTGKSIRCIGAKANEGAHPFSGDSGPRPSSSVCVPCSGVGRTACVFQAIDEEVPARLTDEECDVIEMVVMISEIALGRNESPWQAHDMGRVLMRARGITREYQSGDSVIQVLRGVDLDVHDGEFLVLLGESGCGKSTLLNIMGGMDVPTAGSFEFDGKEMLGASEHELAKYRRGQIGFVFQSYNLMPTLRARQNLDLIGELAKNPIPTREALEMVGLSERMDSKPSQLSGGQQQRVSIARALVKRPRAIFADEPTAALDYETSIDVLEAFDKVVRAGTTVVMVTHNEEICRMAHRVVRVRMGRVSEVMVNQSRARACDLSW